MEGIKKMENELVEKVWNWNDFTEAAANSVIAFGVGKAASIALSTFFDIHIDEYNSVEHLAMGIGIGTYAYRRAGGGAKGMAAAALTTTTLLGGWEILESQIPSYREELIDSITDMAIAYTGSNIFAPLMEKVKKKFGGKKGKKKN